MTGLYGAAFDRVAARMGEHLDRVLRETREASVLFEELLLQPRERRFEQVRSEPRLWLLKLCGRLQAASRMAWGDDPAAAVEMAELAVEVAERLDPERYGEPLVGDTRALAWAYLGNARRITSDLDGAEEALAHAERLYRLFEADLLTEAEILVFQASLRNTRGRFAEATALLEGAIWLYREAGDLHQEGRTLILKGMVLGDGGDFEGAVAGLAEGLQLIEAAAEPRLTLAAHHNLAWYLCDHGKPGEAAEALQRNRPLYLELGSRMDLVRLRWLEGRIALGLGRPAEAVQALSLARDAFLEQEIGFDAAMVSLDLAMAHARQGDMEGVKRIASEIIPVFQACRVQTEGLASLLLLRSVSQSAQAEAVLDVLAAGLRRARRAGRD